jgi:hypothetical protein
MPAIERDPEIGGAWLRRGLELALFGSSLRSVAVKGTPPCLRMLRFVIDRCAMMLLICQDRKTSSLKCDQLHQTNERIGYLSADRSLQTAENDIK